MRFRKPSLLRNAETGHLLVTANFSSQNSNAVEQITIKTESGVRRKSRFPLMPVCLISIAPAYIPIKRGFLYLTVVIGWHSRGIAGWEVKERVKTMQSFLIFFYILDQGYNQCKEDDLGGFLGANSPELWEDGQPAEMTGRKLATLKRLSKAI